ncbi:MAG: hypothetical protein ACN6PN_19475 [Sphingobacterium sp.]
MLSLNDNIQWGKLGSPFGNSEEVPELIEKLIETAEIDLLVEITTEYITHQMSLYEVTFAAFPHLVTICENSHDKAFQLETLLSTAVMLSEYGGDHEIDSIFANSKIQKDQIDDLKSAFKTAFKKLKPLAHSLEEYVLQKDESERKYFLLTLAVAYECYFVASILWRYHENEEYECCCPNCDETLILWNEDNKLVLYKEDPVFIKEQEKFAVDPSSLSPLDFSETIFSDKNYEWLSYYIHSLDIIPLKTTINYLFGTTHCPYCKMEIGVFENIQ